MSFSSSVGSGSESYTPWSSTTTWQVEQASELHRMGGEGAWARAGRGAADSADKLRKLTTGCEVLIAAMGLEERKRG